MAFFSRENQCIFIIDVDIHQTSFPLSLDMPARASYSSLKINLVCLHSQISNIPINSCSESNVLLLFFNAPVFEYEAK